MQCQELGQNFLDALLRSVGALKSTLDSSLAFAFAEWDPEVVIDAIHTVFNEFASQFKIYKDFIVSRDRSTDRLEV